MHDATSALGGVEEAKLLGVLAARLPAAAIIAIAHRPIAESLYQRRIAVAPAR